MASGVLLILWRVWHWRHPSSARRPSNLSVVLFKFEEDSLFKLTFFAASFFVGAFLLVWLGVGGAGGCDGLLGCVPSCVCLRCRWWRHIGLPRRACGLPWLTRLTRHSLRRLTTGELPIRQLHSLLAHHVDLLCAHHRMRRRWPNHLSVLSHHLCTHLWGYLVRIHHAWSR